MVIESQNRTAAFAHSLSR